VIEHNELGERLSLELTPFQQSFLDLPLPELQRLLLAALYLDIRGLFALAAYRSSLTLPGKTPEQIRQEWGLEDDLTEEEKQAIRDANPWVREGERRV
jgi:S-phase kinase-associated protein 1